MKISGIAAIGKNRELGSKNKLLWHIPGELKRFKKITMGHPIIMGRRTYDSIGKPLPGRLNIVISHSNDNEQEKIYSNIIFATSLEDALKKAKQKEKHEIFIIGGGQIFKEAMPSIQRLYLTIVDSSFSSADVFFPDYSDFTEIIGKEDFESEKYKYTFLTIEKLDTNKFT